MTYNIYGFWDINCNRQILFVILGYFLSFYPLTAQKMKISKKWKHLETSSFYTSVPKLLIISYTVLEILCVTHVIVVFHFGQFFALLHPPHNNQKKKNFTDKKRQEISSFYTSVPKIMIICYIVLEIWCVTTKWKKNADLINLYQCTENHDYMLYCSWNMVCDWCNCHFSFRAAFCPFTPLTAQKIKITIKWKKYPEISSFCTSVPKIMIICSTVPKIWHVTHVIVIFLLGLFFYPFYPLHSPKNRKFKKEWKRKFLEISPFYICVP